jgi:glutamine synthetase
MTATHVTTKGIRMSQRNTRMLTVEDLRGRIGVGAIDTVVVAFTDMQGRLQGKRLHAQ